MPPTPETAALAARMLDHSQALTAALSRLLDVARRQSKAIADRNLDLYRDLAHDAFQASEDAAHLSDEIGAMSDAWHANEADISDAFWIPYVSNGVEQGNLLFAIGAEQRLHSAGLVTLHAARPTAESMVIA